MSPAELKPPIAPEQRPASCPRSHRRPALSYAVWPLLVAAVALMPAALATGSTVLVTAGVVVSGMAWLADRIAPVYDTTAIDSAMARVSEAAQEVAGPDASGGGAPAGVEASPPPGSVDRLIAALAELAVAQNQPRRDPFMKTYLLPVMLVLLTVSVPAAALIREATRDDDVDCGGYITAVLSIGGEDATSTTLEALVDRLDFGNEAKECGVTPRQILEGAGKIT